jgi:hypothetical protein
MALNRAESELADGIVENLSLNYQVTVVKDWGETTDEGAGVEWRAGEWSLDELHTLQSSISGLANAMGGTRAFIDKLGGIIISQEAIKYRGLASSRGVKFTSSPVSIDQWTVVHELAHVWDAHSKWRLSKALEDYTGGYTSLIAMLVKRWRTGFDEERRLPGCNRFGYFYGDVPPAGSDQNFNRKEDFAESVAGYVYPLLVQPRVDRFKDDERYRSLLYYPDYTETKRWSFVKGLIEGTVFVK